MLDGVPMRRGQPSHAHRKDGVAGFDADVVGVLALMCQMSPFFPVKDVGKMDVVELAKHPRCMYACHMIQGWVMRQAFNVEVVCVGCGVCFVCGVDNVISCGSYSAGRANCTGSAGGSVCAVANRHAAQLGVWVLSRQTVSP